MKTTDIEGSLYLPRVKGFTGEVNLPGSKSIANRSLLLAALAEGSTTLENIPDADDVRIMIEALRQLGVKIERQGTMLVVYGCSGVFPVQAGEINLENAGTALRPMVALLAIAGGSYTVDGNEAMRKRPIYDLVYALSEAGIDISCENGNPPVHINSTGLEADQLKVSGRTSSQFLSALLMAAPLAKNPLEIIVTDEAVSRPYIDLTLATMSEFGIEVVRNGYSNFRIKPEMYRSPEKKRIEGDATAASYYAAAGALPDSGPVTIFGLNRNSPQGDVQFISLLSSMGARVEWKEGSVTVTGEVLDAPDVDMNDMPDAAMTLAVLALFSRGVTHIRNIGNLRVKESERITGLHTELEKFGAFVEEETDALHITPPARLQKALVNTYQDHRMAMAFSLLSFGTDLEIHDPGCVSKTYPNFFKDFLPLGQTMEAASSWNRIKNS